MIKSFVNFMLTAGIVITILVIVAAITINILRGYAEYKNIKK